MPSLRSCTSPPLATVPTLTPFIHPSDNDGDLDLFMGSQSLFHELSTDGSIWEYHIVFNQFWINNGDGEPHHSFASL